MGGARSRRARPAAAPQRPRDRQDRRHAAAVRRGGRCGRLCRRIPPRARRAADSAEGARRAACRCGDPAREHPRRHPARRQAARGRRHREADRGARDGARAGRPDPADRGCAARARPHRLGAAVAWPLGDEGTHRTDRDLRDRGARRVVLGAARWRQGLPGRAGRRALAAGQEDPEQPAAAGHLVSRPRARTRRREGAARQDAAADAARHGRARQDPAVVADCRGGHGRLPGRRLVPRPRADPGPGAGRGRGGARARRSRGGRPPADPEPVQPPEDAQDAADLRQLRAPREGRGGPGRRVAARRTESHHRCLEPRGLAGAGRAGLPDPAAAGTAPGRRARDARAVDCGTAVRRAGAAAQAGVRADRARSTGRGRTRCASRRHPARPRAGRGADPLADGDRHQRAPEGPLQAPHRRRSGIAGAAADAASAGRLVVRPAESGRADGARPPWCLCRRLRPAGGRAGLRRRSAAAGGHPRRARRRWSRSRW